MQQQNDDFHELRDEYRISDNIWNKLYK